MAGRADVVADVDEVARWRTRAVHLVDAGYLRGLPPAREVVQGAARGLPVQSGLGFVTWREGQ